METHSAAKSLHWSRGLSYHGVVHAHGVFEGFGYSPCGKGVLSCDGFVYVIFKLSYLDGLYVQDMYNYCMHTRSRCDICREIMNLSITN